MPHSASHTDHSPVTLTSVVSVLMSFALLFFVAWLNWQSFEGRGSDGLFMTAPM